VLRELPDPAEERCRGARPERHGYLEKKRGGRFCGSPSTVTVIFSW
jgi:hypothetical protein